MALGHEGVRAKDKPLTFAEGWAELRSVLVRQVEAGHRSARTLETYEYGAKLLSAWNDTPLARLSDVANEVIAKRHAEITKERWPRAADFAMIALRRVYNYAYKRQLDKNLPHFNPVKSIELVPPARRDTAMGADDLAEWHRKLRALPNPVRQEFHLFTLLSGSRAGALTVARWEHLNMKRRVLHIPKPKGGAKRAFDIPLSRAMIACLARVRRAGRMVNAVNAAEWIFPGELSRSHKPGFEGHIVEYREDRADLPKWGGDPRRSASSWASSEPLAVGDGPGLDVDGDPGPVACIGQPLDRPLNPRKQVRAEAVFAHFIKPVDGKGDAIPFDLEAFAEDGAGIADNRRRSEGVSRLVEVVVCINRRFDLCHLVVPYLIGGTPPDTAPDGAGGHSRSVRLTTPARRRLRSGWMDELPAIRPAMRAKASMKCTAFSLL